MTTSTPATPVATPAAAPAGAKVAVPVASEQHAVIKAQPGQQYKMVRAKDGKPELVQPTLEVALRRITVIVTATSLYAKQALAGLFAIPLGNLCKTLTTMPA
jgi:hypothetical protein